MVRRSRTLLAKPLASALLPFLVAGCVMGPDYQKPEMAQPDQFRSQISGTDATSFADLAWWEVFNDTALQSLISDALTHNYDLQVAVARIEQARAMVGEARSEGLPQIGYGAFAGGDKTVTPENERIDTARFGSIGGAINAAWELDIWGRIKRSTEAAEANLLAQEEVRRGVMLTLVSDIASGYFRLLQLDRELAIAQESQTAYRDTHGLFSLRYENGRDSRLPSERAKAALDSSSASIADLKREIAQQENALSVLAGGYPRAIERGAPLTAQTMPPNIPAGLTTDLLRRRPDIRKAEQEMVRANAEVGAAVASFYPKIGLSAVFGMIGIDADNGLDGDFNFWRAGAALSGPLFTGGRLEAIYKERQAFWDETVASYKQTVLIAFRETSDALVAQQTLVDRRAALETQVAALRQSVDLAMIRYRGGRATYFEVLEAQQQLFPAEDQLARVQQAQLVAVVNLYKALGGGWKLTDDQWAKPG
ncbi:efflux transporter outer membrane subunit [Sphingomonas sp. DBB INV C78]|uniref:efflux transporter outer membrane subunit n=1 Tax=Sphingomonas sp. DBB INV C78 TaxID=3349434 RepID=UPI0036D3EE81